MVQGTRSVIFEKLGIGNECYHIKYENILRNFADFLPSAFFDSIDYMFCNTDIERIDAHSSVENPASSKVMEKAGMHYEGLLKHYYKTRDGFQDCTLYGIIREEWEERE